MKKRTEKQRLATAHHEAGHAVAALQHDLPFKYVTIKREEGSLGHLFPKDPKWFQPEYGSDDRHQAYIVRKVVSFYAGPLAEKMLIGRANHGGAGGDYAQAVKYAMYACGDENEGTAFLGWLIKRTQNFVTCKPNRIRIEAVASALLERETLTFVEVRAVCIEAIDSAIAVERALKP